MGSGTISLKTGNHSESTHYGPALGAIILLFFTFGFLTCLNDILIPHLKSLFDLSYGQVMLVQFCFFFAYFVGSIPFGRLVHLIGYKAGIIMGLCIAGSGAALFYPAAEWQSFGTFLTAFFTLALGITLLQVAANPYVAILGPQSSAQSRLSLVQAFNSLGTTLAPIFGSALILNATAQSFPQALSEAEKAAFRIAKADAIKGPYLVLALSLFALAFIVYLFRLPHLEAEGSTNRPSNSARPSTFGILKHRHLAFGAVGIFAYVGGEVAIGSFLVNFLSDPQIAGISPGEAGKYVSMYWGGAMIGRFIGSWAMTRVRPTHLLAFNGIMAALLVLVTLLTTGNVAMFAILSVGLFNSIMFPTIFTLAIRDLGALTAQGSGILCMAIVGGAVIPLLQGVLADQIGVHSAFVIPIVCYLYIVFYALHGHRVSGVQALG